MWNALFAFEQSSRADNAERILLDAGLAGSQVKVHRRASGPPEAAANVVDEQVTGGVLTNLYNLFQGVFDWGGSPHDASSYEAVVNRGGAVIDVCVGDEAGCRMVDGLLVELSDLRTQWDEIR